MLSGPGAVRAGAAPEPGPALTQPRVPFAAPGAAPAARGRGPGTKGVAGGRGRGLSAVAGQERRRGRAPRSHWRTRGGRRGPPYRVYIRVGRGRCGQSGGGAGAVFVLPCTEPCPGCGSGWRAASGAAWRPPTASLWAAPPARREVSVGPSRAGGRMRVPGQRGWWCCAPADAPKTPDRCFPEPPAQPRYTPEPLGSVSPAPAGPPALTCLCPLRRCRVRRGGLPAGHGPGAAARPRGRAAVR